MNFVIKHRGMTLVETIITVAVSSILFVGVAVLLSYLARTEQLNITRSIISKEAGITHDKVQKHLRNAKKGSDSVTFGDDVAGKPDCHYTVEFISGETGATSRISFNNNTKTLTYDPDKDTAGGEETLASKAADPTASQPYIDEFYFENITNGESLSINLTYTDGGASAKSWSNDKVNTMTLSSNIVYRAP